MFTLSFFYKTVNFYLISEEKPSWKICRLCNGSYDKSGMSGFYKKQKGLKMRTYIMPFLRLKVII